MPRSNLALTIGNFDGVHLGHQAVIRALLNSSSQPIVYTFSNHPVEVLYKRPVAHLSTLSHRLAILRSFGIDQILTTPFTQAVSEQSARTFLHTLRETIPFTHLVLGHDAVIGHKREGSAKKLALLASEMSFSLEYIEPCLVDGAIVSSSRIRQALEEGKLKQVARLLGRPYSIRATVEPGEQRGRLLGFQTANLPVIGLCLPPNGVYVVEVIHRNRSYLGVANLGTAPTLHTSRPPLLETHLLEYEGEDLYGLEIEVIFKRFLRPERHFSSLEALKSQITHDITSAKYPHPFKTP